MKLFYKIIFFIISNLIPIFLYAQPSERVLNLEESINTGLHNNQELLCLYEQISLAQQRINEAMSQIFPKIDFNFSTSQFDHDAPTVLSPSFNSVYLPQKKMDLYYATRFSLWQYLYAGGRHTTTVRLAEINLSHAKSQADVIKNKIVLDVRRAFYICIILNEKIKIYENKLAKEKNLDEKNILHSKLIKIKYQYEKQKLEFLKCVGLELNTVIEFKGKLDPYFKEYDLNKCLAWSFQYRPELSQTQFQETIDSLRVHLSLTERYPTITLGANYEWFGDQFPLNETNWNATINLNVPVFDGWASWARIKQRKHQARESKIRRAKIEDQIRFEVRQSYMDYYFWHEQMVNFNESEKMSIEYFDTLLQYLTSRDMLEWSIGKIFFK